jgi:hypothetical protein
MYRPRAFFLFSSYSLEQAIPSHFFLCLIEFGKILFLLLQEEEGNVSLPLWEILWN